MSDRNVFLFRPALASSVVRSHVGFDAWLWWFYWSLGLARSYWALKLRTNINFCFNTKWLDIVSLCPQPLPSVAETQWLVWWEHITDAKSRNLSTRTSTWKPFCSHEHFPHTSRTLGKITNGGAYSISLIFKRWTQQCETIAHRFCPFTLTGMSSWWHGKPGQVWNIWTLWG